MRLDRGAEVISTGKAGAWKGASAEGREEFPAFVPGPQAEYAPDCHIRGALSQVFLPWARRGSVFMVFYYKERKEEKG